MKVVSQILTERPGQTEGREYEIPDLAAALTANSDRRKHVTLYPGNYASEWNSQVEIPIPEKVSVTLLPGTVVEYSDGFRNQNYDGYNGDVIEATDQNGDPSHPLSEPSNDRYVRPNFTGHVENITDLNLASEWAFKQEFERALWTLRNAETENTVDVPHKGIFEIRTGEAIKATIGEVQGIEDGPYLELKHSDIYTRDNSVQENTSEVIQNLEIDKGHIKNVNVIEVVERLEATGSILSVSENRGKIDIVHDGSGKEVRDASDEEAVFDFETGPEGHVQFVEHGAVVKEIGAGRGLQKATLDPGKFEIAHEEIEIGGSPQNSGPTLVQSINPYIAPDNTETGHISGVEVLDIVEGSNITINTSALNRNLEINVEPRVENRPPNQGEGENGDIWLVEE